MPASASAREPAGAFHSLLDFPREDPESAARWLLERACEHLGAAGACWKADVPAVSAPGARRIELPAVVGVGSLADPAATPAAAAPTRRASVGDAAGVLALDCPGAAEWSVERRAWWEAFGAWFALALESAALRLRVARLQYDATHDPLTGLPNRHRLRAEISSLVESVQARHSRGALLLLDLDHFKEVNDALGHAVGDRLLQAVAQWLLEAVRDGDTVVRLGGDEFVVLMRDAAQRIEAALLARRLCEIVANGYQAIEDSVRVTASIGVALCPDHGTEVETLLRHADLAMYDAKQAGRDTFRFWNPRRPAPPPNRVMLESHLREAIERGQLALVYQPQARLSDGSIAGLESLLRVDHPTLGTVAPEALMAVAETTSVMEDITAWGLAETCRQALAWREQGLLSGWIAVNVPAAAVQHARFPGWVAEALRVSGLPADALVIELTERSLVRNIGFAAEMLSRLGALGVKIGIDDFGVGHSALGYLNRLPVHKIKLDRSFVEGLPGDTDSAAIVRNLIRMARELGLQVIAEGVETAEQADWLREAGCDLVQGYLIARPMRPAQTEAFLRRHAGR